MKKLSKTLTGSLIVGILLVALFIRLQGTKTLPTGLFRGPDAYHYYWLAHLITEDGQLPARDMHRWVPIGRDLTQTLNLLTQTEPKHIYTHKAFREVFVPVYPTENFESARVKVWELHYPPDIQADTKYLRTGIPEIDAQLLQH